MDKCFAGYMRCGKLVKTMDTGEVFKLVADMDENKDIVRAVSFSNLRRFELLTAWDKNWEQNSYGFRDHFTENIEDCRIERQNYIEELNIADLFPHNTIRFITPNYETKFEVRDLSCVSVNGVAARATYIDEYHFTFVDKINTSFYGGCFHICQFAEICEREGVEVKEIEDFKG